ncbi:MAG: ABC transporter permease subunit [Bacillota bacterium]|nr:ABC transporter permease subunit [Bacillota bacterium]
MNFALFKSTVKSNWILFVIFLAVLFMYMSIIISMYDPENIEAMALYLETLPQGMVDAFGYNATATDLVSFIGLYFYGFIVLLFPLIFCIVLTNRLVAALVDRGSMAYLLATPNTRIKIITTQAIFVIIAVSLLLFLNTLAGIAMCEGLFPGELDIPVYLKLNFATLMLTTAISSISFFFSCIFNESKYALAFGAGLPILFFVINMVRNIGSNSEWLKYLTIYTLYDPQQILSGEQSVLMISLVFGVITLVLYTGGIVIFSRRNLYL